MRLAVVSKWRKAIERELSGLGVAIVRKGPDIVFCVGGDGTFLYAEILYPGVPKVLIHHKCSECRGHDFGPIIESIRNRRYRVREELKLACVVNGNSRKTFVGLNDMNIHYRLPCAIGLEVSVNGKVVSRNLGDGLIVSTPFGSTGYFRSITRRTFRKGIGMAFNNPVIREKSLVVPESSVIRAKVTRGAGYLACDCNRKVIPLRKGDRVEIRRHGKRARILQIGGKSRISL